MKWILELSEYLLWTKENHLSWLTNLKNTRINKTWTSIISLVNRFYALTFIHSWLYSCTFFIYPTSLYIFLYMFEINYTLVDLMWGHIEVHGGECHSVHLELPFSPSWLGTIRTFALTFCSEWLPLLRGPAACADIPTKSGYDVIGMSGDDVGLFDDDIYVSITLGLGGIKGWMYRRKGFPVLRF